MLGLIEADVTTTWKSHLSNGTPSCLFNLRACNTLLCERSHLGFQVVAHEVEFVDIVFRRMECGFCQRQGEDQPAITSIHRFEPEDVAEKSTVCLSVPAVNNYVSARNHLPSLYARK